VAVVVVAQEDHIRMFRELLLQEPEDYQEHWFLQLPEEVEQQEQVEQPQRWEEQAQIAMDHLVVQGVVVAVLR
jgi:hypothetical protein